MSAPVWIALAAVGGAGAVLRFAVDGWVDRRTDGSFPSGTLAVNLSGALVLGLVAGIGLHGAALAIVATGALGSYTTFSTWMFESHQLGADGSRRLLVLNLVLSIAAGVAAAALGRWIGTGL